MKHKKFKIKRRNGTSLTVIVDSEDYPIISRFTWSLKKDKYTFYAYTTAVFSGKKHSISMHRLITGMVSSIIDHKNRNGLDNRKSNLRHCTAQQNSWNRPRKNTLGYRGIYMTNKKYGAQLCANGKYYKVYGFKTAKEAAKKYDELNRKHHGEFGIRNFDG